MSRQPRFEVVRSDHGWFARFRAANGRIVWVTEVYARRRAAREAIDALLRFSDFGTTRHDESGGVLPGRVVSIASIDERTAA